MASPKQERKSEESVPGVVSAAANGELSRLAEELCAGADANDASEPDGRTALMAASARQQAACVGLLLEHGAEVDRTAANGTTALLEACEKCASPMECARLLLEGSADVERERPGDGMTACVAACARGKLDLVKLMVLEYGASVNNGGGNVKPLVAAVRGGFVDVAAFLIESGAAAVFDPECLVSACFHGQTACARILLESGARVDAATLEDGTTPLYAAARSDSSIDCLRLLVERGATVDKPKRATGSTPLLVAAQNGAVRAATFLLDSGAAVDKPPSQTPLYVASFHGRRECVALLLQRGAAVNRARRDGSTPLFAAALNGHAACLKTLLAHGANPRVATALGCGPLDAARASGHDDCVNLILAHANPARPARSSSFTRITSRDRKHKKSYPLPIACRIC